MSLLRCALAAVLLACLSSMADGQRPRNEQPGATPRRDRMEQQFQRNLSRITKRQLGLSDAQLMQLQETSRRFDERRRGLAAEERSLRATLRRELLAETKAEGAGAGDADQKVVASALDRLHVVQRERVDVQIEEQRAFAAFMTPVQRARYAALQEHVRRRAELLRRNRPESLPPRRR